MPIHAIQRRPRAQRGGEHLVAAGIVNRANSDRALATERNRHAEIRDALDEVQAAADRVDDPELVGIEGERLVVGSLLGQNPEAGCFAPQHVQDGVLHLERSARDDIAVALPAHVIGLADSR
jgi:hypothetical protein